LNLTENGPGLENCECASDPLCKSTKRAIEPCLPKIRHTGCTEARKECEKDPECGTAMRDYLYHCRKLFGGERCSDDCRRVITHMHSIPKARLLDTCVCDGTERTICEYVKVSMRNLCFNSPDRHAGSGFSDDEDDLENDYEMEDYEEEDNAGYKTIQLCCAYYVHDHGFLGTQTFVVALSLSDKYHASHYCSVLTLNIGEMRYKAQMNTVEYEYVVRKTPGVIQASGGNQQ
ncbi:hypothetical protein P4O66_016123, partial [Electrophorus voltai]